jgi:UDP-glucose 4-epimerase
MTKKILITGGSGFIARSLYEYLSACYFSPLEKSVFCLGREELDLLDSKKVFSYIKKNNFDVVIHAATYDAVPEFTIKDKSKVLENNLKMFFNLARCQGYFGKMLYFGSGAEADRNNWIPRMNEAYIDSFVPSDQYAFSKHISNEYTKISKNIYNLRLFGLFGKYDDWRYRFISNACCKAVLGMPITVKQNVFFDYLYVDDFNKIVRWFIENEANYKSYNVCAGQSYDYLTLAKKIKDTSQKDVDIIVENEQMRREYSGDNTLLQSEMDINFQDIDTSIRSLYNWYEENKSIIREVEFVY